MGTELWEVRSPSKGSFERLIPHMCRICGKTFKQRQGLIRHRTVHTGEKPHTCNLCGKHFTRTSTMYKHMKGHACIPGSATVTDDKSGQHQKVSDISERQQYYSATYPSADQQHSNVAITQMFYPEGIPYNRNDPSSTRDK